jgi:hypothetical protein
MKQWDEKDLDGFLDRTLSEYSGEPRAGLEQRVLANLAGAEAQPRRWWIWAAVPAFATILVAVLLWTAAAPKPVAPPTVAKAPSAPAVTKTPVPPVVAHVHRGSPKRGVVARSAPATPRLATFPSQDDDSQVQLALRFVQSNPALAQQLVKEQQEFQEAAARRFALEDRQNGSETQ